MKFRNLLVATIGGLAFASGSASAAGANEVAVTGAPIPDGTSLQQVVATRAANISLGIPINGSDPGANPTMYDNLVFTMLPSCRIYDSRPGSGGAGTWLAGTTHSVPVGPYGSYAFQGGSATDCGMTAGASADGTIAAVMVAVSTVNQTGSGYLTFYSDTMADPSATVVSMWFQAGLPVQTSFIVMATDRFADVYSRGTIKNHNSDVIIDVIGYFAKPKMAALDCVNVNSTGGSAAPGGGDSGVSYPACGAGYSRTGGYCYGPGFVNNSGYLIETGASSCVYRNFSATAFGITAVSTCCRVPGR